VDRSNFDRFYADNTGLIHTVARKGFRRLQAIGASIEYEDVVQELTEVFIKSFDHFDEASGNRFSSYFVPAAYRKVNSIAEDYEKERIELKIHSFEEMNARLNDGNHIEETICSGISSVEDQIDAGRLAVRILGGLSPLASMIAQMAIDPPEFMEHEFSAAQAHAEYARGVGVELRARGSLNLSFVCSALEKADVLPASVIRSAKREVIKAVKRNTMYE
jgi:hypothetical protein